MNLPCTKTCTKCLVTQPLEAFPPRKEGKYGKDSRCYTCKRLYRLAYDKANWEDIRARNATYHANHLAAHKVRDKHYRGSHRPQIQAKNKRLYAQQKSDGRRWQDRFPEEKRASDRASYHKHQGKRAAYRMANRQRRAQQWQQWATEHHDHLLTYRQTHREEKKATEAAWRQAYPARNAAREHRRRARQQSLPHTWTVDEVAFMLQYWHNACAACGNQQGFWWKLAHDHWIPLTSPECPGTVATNMIPLCHGDNGCNNMKNNTAPDRWLLRRFGKKKAAQIANAVQEYFALVALTFPTP